MKVNLEKYSNFDAFVGEYEVSISIHSYYCRNFYLCNLLHTLYGKLVFDSFHSCRYRGLKADKGLSLEVKSWMPSATERFRKPQNFLHCFWFTHTFISITYIKVQDQVEVLRLQFALFLEFTSRNRLISKYLVFDFKKNRRSPKYNGNKKTSW